MKIIRFVGTDGRSGYSAQREDGSAVRIEGDIFGAFQVTQEPVRVAKLLAPVEPAAIWCIGLNYRRHAEETGAVPPSEPVVFAKGLNSVQHPGGAIEIPKTAASQEVDYECELAVVIGRTCKNVPRERALDCVLGYTCANDVSARDWQLKRGGSQWCRGKSFDTFAPLGPCLVTRDDIPDPSRLRIQTILNHEVVQDWTTGDMIFDVPALIEFLSASTTLEAGTVIMTGTPQGVGMARKPPRWLRPGDTVSIAIENIGTLTNPVVMENGA